MPDESRELIAQQQQAPEKIGPEMTLAHAKNILERIAAGDLDTISFPDMQQAIEVVTTHIFTTREKSTNQNSTSIRKSDPPGRMENEKGLTAMLTRSFDPFKVGDPEVLKGVGITITNEKNQSVVANIPVVRYPKLTGFRLELAQRENIKFEDSLSSLNPVRINPQEMGFDADNVRRLAPLVIGIRILALNLARWEDPRIYTPADLTS